MDLAKFPYRDALADEGSEHSGGGGEAGDPNCSSLGDGTTMLAGTWEATMPCGTLRLSLMPMPRGDIGQQTA
ncbi:hypothetical protein Nepgr_006549 [Nepenthes gracilis]|uniref:Uncharacterized protein n=1 Tax=Nepenthes gracilis TaxID=150966 RepID=A0AAD3XHG4_NEPGR|nr:hypothetical protein Nepgr_006549 [Nepenthes gracilis]